MKFLTLILTFGLFFSISGFTQQTTPDTTKTKLAVSETDSLLSSIEEIPEDSLKSLDESLYKDIWSTTQIKYPVNTLPNKNDTIIITILGDSTAKFIQPVRGQVISKFGPRHGRMHTGTDIRLNSGDTVRCAFDGKVRIAKRFSGYGNLVLVRHSNGLETIYGHLKAIKVKVNDTIKAGDLVGLGGRTGRATCNHLHFETRLFGQPFDSNKYIDFENATLRSDKVYYANKRAEIDLHNFKKKPLPSDGVELAAGGATKHVIRKGDNLSSIARRYHTSVRKICAANKITAQTTLKIGRVLRIN